MTSCLGSSFFEKGDHLAPDFHTPPTAPPVSSGRLHSACSGTPPYCCKNIDKASVFLPLNTPLPASSTCSAFTHCSSLPYSCSSLPPSTIPCRVLSDDTAPSLSAINDAYQR
jgi:hypothetical protein